MAAVALVGLPSLNDIHGHANNGFLLLALWKAAA
jgi:hypothetical protein